MPGDDPARQFLPGDADETLRETLGTDTSKESAETNIRADQAQLTLHLRELQIVHANDLGAVGIDDLLVQEVSAEADRLRWHGRLGQDRKSTCLNSSHGSSSYAVFCLKKKNCRKAREGPVPSGREPCRGGESGPGVPQGEPPVLDSLGLLTNRSYTPVYMEGVGE